MVASRGQGYGKRFVSPGDSTDSLPIRGRHSKTSEAKLLQSTRLIHHLWTTCQQSGNHYSKWSQVNVHADLEHLIVKETLLEYKRKEAKKRARLQLCNINTKAVQIAEFGQISAPDGPL